MIGFLKGKLIDIDLNAGKITILCSDVGYLVNITALLLSEYNIDDNIELYVVPEIRKDAFELFGFKDTTERNYYRKLRTVSGIGPKTALNILNLDVQSLNNAIKLQDVKTLCTIPGLGKKTAERLILELSGNLPDLNETDSNTNLVSENVVLALESFGYKRKDIQKILEPVLEEITEDQDLIKYFLKSIR